MRVETSGITRTVFIFKNIVIKVPKIRYGWYYFLLGLCANIEENKCWTVQKFMKTDDVDYRKWLLLCPVKYCSWGGWILIMPRVQICTEEEIVDYRLWKDAGFGGDDKPDNYGWYQGRIVKVDYPNFTDKTR